MEREFIVRCGRCHMPIPSGDGFVRFKIPGNKSYLFFHCRFHGGDCWELKESKWESVAWLGLQDRCFRCRGGTNNESSEVYESWQERG
jgi:hypothetical protein